MAKSFYALGEHMLSGRIDLTQDQISCHAISTDVRTQLTSWRSTRTWLADIYNVWLAYEIPRVAVTPTPVLDTDEDDAVYRVVVPDIRLENQASYSALVYALLFFVDTGDPATSPLIGFDELGRLELAENSTYVYKSSPDGLIQIALP